MDLKETAMFLIAMNQTDPRVQSNATADKDWHHSLAVLTVDEARQAWREFLRLGDGAVPHPNGIRKIGLGIRSRRQAQQRAIEPPRRPLVDPRPSPERWKQLMAEGQAERERQLGVNA